MPFRKLSLFAALALVLAACSADEGSTTSSAAASEQTTTTSAPQPEPMLLSYTLEPGSSFTYEVDLDQQIDLTSEGDGTAVGDEEIPAQMSISLTGTTPFTYTVSEGPEPGTFEVRIEGEFGDLSVAGTVDGEPVESDDVPEMAEMAPIDVTIVVDEHGNPVSRGGEQSDFGNALGGLEGFGDITPGPDLGRLVGPPLPEEPVTVGDTWSDTVETPSVLGGEGKSITTETTSEVIGTDSIAGADVLVIETQITTSSIEFDLAEFLAGFLSALAPEGASAEDTAELEAMMEDLRFLLNIDEVVEDATTWFDAGAGVARQAEFVSSTHMTMDVNMPDETTGEMLGFMLDMTVEQTTIYRLIDSTTS